MVNIKRITFFGTIFFCIGISFGYFLYYSYMHRLIRIKDFRGIKEGSLIPGFAATSDGGTHFTSTTPSGNFFVYFINQDNPGIIQFDSENGSKADIVIKNGGHISTNKDTKALLAFKIRSFYEKKWWKKITTYKKQPEPQDLVAHFDASLMIVTDQNGKITGIYTNAKWKHLKRILSDMHLLKFSEKNS